MKSPNACQTLGHIRTAVNTIDRQLIRLLGKRTQYARAAFAFKTDLKSIGQPAHRKKLFAQRKVWAKQCGADPRMIERIYQAVVAESKRMHLAAYKSRKRGTPKA